ncbi:MAG: tetratricopeptide repeat protein [Candidatus Aminicenantaceae bacterium]
MHTNPFRIKNIGIFAFLFLLVLNLGANLCLAQEEKAPPSQEMQQKFKASNNKYYIKAKKYFVNEKYTKAENLLKQCIETYPKHANAYYLLAQIDYKKGNFLEALENIKKAKTYSEDFIDMHILIKKQNIENLETNLEQLRSELEFQQTSGRIQNIRSSITETREQIKEKRNDYKNFMASTAQMRSDYYYTHGNIFFKMKAYPKAVNQYSEAIKINPKHGKAYNNLAIIFFLAKQYQKALDFLNKAESQGVEINQKLKEDIMSHLKEPSS